MTITHHNIKAVLFDLDGTLIDTAADFMRILGIIAKQNNWQVPSADKVREQVSAGAAAMVKLMLQHNNSQSQNIDAETITTYRQQFLDEYSKEICVDSCVFDGLETLLTDLENQNIPWGIVTNKPRKLAEQLLDALQLDQRCKVLVCPDDVSNSKPDPEPMFLALNKLSQTFDINCDDAKQVVYVGDHIRDIKAGNAADMVTILAGYGYIPPEDKHNLTGWNADYIVDTANQLTGLLLSDTFSYVAPSKHTD